MLQNPQKVEPDGEDPELAHAFGTIPEYDGRVLLVIYNQTTNPWKIISVRIDSKYKGKL